MKVSYNADGQILAVARDSEQLGETILDIVDDEDVLLNINKYRVDVTTTPPVLVKRPYLVLSTTNNSAPADGVTEITINVDKFDADDVQDALATDSIDVMSLDGVLCMPLQFHLINGSGSFVLKSTKPGNKQIICTSSDAYQGMLQVEFI